MKEIWKPILSTNGWHEISNFGRIRSWVKHRGRYGIRKEPKILKQQTDNRGYKRIQLFNKPYSIHRLVAQGFVDNKENKFEVNHIDGNKLNNMYSNLEWCTRSENMKHAFSNSLVTNMGEKNPTSKLSENDVLDIRNAYNLGCFSQKEISKSYGVSYNAINSIINKKTWRHL